MMYIIYGVPYMIICGYFRTQFINRRMDEKETHKVKTLNDPRNNFGKNILF